MCVYAAQREGLPLARNVVGKRRVCKSAVVGVTGINGDTQRGCVCFEGMLRFEYGFSRVCNVVVDKGKIQEMVNKHSCVPVPLLGQEA